VDMTWCLSPFSTPGPTFVQPQLPFVAYCEKEFPLGSVRQRTDQQSKLHGQAALEFVIREVANVLKAAFRNLPQTLQEGYIDALVLDQVDYGLGLVPMHPGIPYVHVSNALHLDYSGNTPLATFDWPHETTPAASIRNQEGVRKRWIRYFPESTKCGLHLISLSMQC
jgi:zeaxanthin glucosyltransferase